MAKKAAAERPIPPPAPDGLSPDALLAQFLASDEASITLKKDQLAKLLAKAQTAPLTLTENKLVDQLRSELKEASEGPREAASSPAQGESFANLLSVSKYLEAQGWKLGKSTVYNHRAQGKLQPSPDGRYLRAAVDLYATMHLKRNDGLPTTPAATEIERLQRESIEEELAARRIQRRRQELKLASEEKTLVPRDFFEKEIAARATVFRSDIENFFRGEASALIDVASGNQAKAPDLIDYCLSAAEKWLSRYAQDREFEADPAQNKPSPAASSPEDELDDEDLTEDPEDQDDL